MFSEKQHSDFHQAIISYDFPAVVYDFTNNCEIKMANMIAVEQFIYDQLTSQDLDEVKNGLSNVLHWGHATAGYRDVRVQRFRSKVTSDQLQKSSQLFRRSITPSLHEIKVIGMPEYSGISFISKIRMFLSPETSAVLDKRIVKMKFTECGPRTVLGELSHSVRETQIRPSNHNSEVYKKWCDRLVEISKNNFAGKYRAVDIERGFFKLIEDSNQIEYAAELLSVG